MLYKNHLIVSNVVILPIMSITNTCTISNLIVLGIGSLLPDIDEPHSYIGKRTRGISDLINSIFGHRGITHTLFSAILVFLISICIGISFGHIDIGIYFSLGYFLHILEDGFSKSGVKWFWPICNKTFKFRVYYVTGSLVEFFIGIAAMLIIYFQITKLGYKLDNDEFFNINNITNLFFAVREGAGGYLLK
ncbi:metal-dependent hydrolase [Clostridium sporogenes]